MNSCLYTCVIHHRRHSPKVYSFKHTVFMFYLDLDELPQLPKVSNLLGFNRSRIYEFRDSDHIRATPGSIKENICAYVKAQGLNTPIKRIMLLTNLRTFGYIFNPVSFYYCFDLNDEPLCVVSEIGNTFGELKYFYLGPEKKTAHAFRDEQVKYYYISPFTDLDNHLDFNIQVPDEQLGITIDTLKAGKKFFYASMQGSRQALTHNRLWLLTLKFPWVTAKVIALIYWHAAVLHFIKRIGHQPKEDNPELQREVHRAWRKR